MNLRIGAIVLATLVMSTACGSEESGPSIEAGGLPVYSIGAPEDVDTLVVAEAIHDVLDLPEDAEPFPRGEFEARIDGGGHGAVVQDRKAGPILVNYSGPRFGNPECLDCPPLDATDDRAEFVARTSTILRAIGIDIENVELAGREFSGEEYVVEGDVVVGGATIDDLRSRFTWTHGGELKQFSGSLFRVEAIGTVARRGEAEARAQAEGMIGSERSITDFEITYTGGFRDGELIVAPAYLVTTDLGTTFTVSAFTGGVPG